MKNHSLPVGCCKKLSLVLAFSASSLSLPAALVVADFDGLTTGTIFGKAGGSGFTGTWSGSANPAVTSGSLSSSLYNLPASSGNRLTGTTDAVRQNYRSLAASMSGEIWFSFLTQAAQTDTGLSYGAGGISFNAPTPTPFNDPGNFYVRMAGNNLQYSFGAGTAGSQSVYAGTAANVTLIVGRMTLGGSGVDDSVDIWVNPDLVADPDIFNYVTAYSSSDVDGLSAINHLGAMTYEVNTVSPAGNVDNIRLSNNPTAYRDVTGVPEPSAMALLLLSSGLWLRRRVR